MDNLRTIIRAVEENDGEWKDWDSVEHIYETYNIQFENRFWTKYTEEEAREILKKAIETNGESLKGLSL